MGKAWDATGSKPNPEFWRLVWEILLPGGYVFAFSGSRTGALAGLRNGAGGLRHAPDARLGIWLRNPKSPCRARGW
jgi:hypothetical protein